MEATALTPSQLRVLDGLMARGQARPTFDADLPVVLRDRLEAGLADVVEGLGVREVAVDKHKLSRVHACEAHHVSERDGFPGWSSANARGTVAHKAIELSVFMPGAPAPLELVDAALDRTMAAGDSWGPGDFLRTASPTELAELRAGATDVVTKFLDGWPPLVAAWRPCVEASVRIPICDDRVVLRAKADLVLGRPHGTQAGRLIVDFKTGRPYPTHADDLRYYALLDTLWSGVPPFRVASYYLDSATFRVEDVTTDVLDAAVHRVVEGVVKLVELADGSRPPTVTPGPTCGWCRLAAECDGARQWAEERAARGLGGDDR